MVSKASWSLLGALGAPGASWVPPGYLLGASWCLLVPPGSLLCAVPPGCLQSAILGRQKRRGPSVRFERPDSCGEISTMCRKTKDLVFAHSGATNHCLGSHAGVIVFYGTLGSGMVDCCCFSSLLVIFSQIWPRRASRSHCHDETDRCVDPFSPRARQISTKIQNFMSFAAYI